MVHAQTASTELQNSVGWLFDNSFVQGLISAGAHVRVKRSHEDIHRSNEVGTVDTTRVIISTPGKMIIPGRRLAEVSCERIDISCLEEPVNSIHLTIYGPDKKFFHRERLFDGPVRSQEEATRLLSELLREQIQPLISRP